MSPERALCGRIDIISRFLAADTRGGDIKSGRKTSIISKAAENELSHRGAAYIAVADEYDPHGRESTRIREMKKAPWRER